MSEYTYKGYSIIQAGDGGYDVTKIGGGLKDLPPPDCCSFATLRDAKDAIAQAEVK